MRILLILLVSGILQLAHGQDSIVVKNLVVKGMVKSSDGIVVLNTFVIRKGVGGQFLNPDGSFKIKLKSNDTLLISATGFNVETFTFENAKADTLFLDIRLSKLHYDLSEHIVMPKRKLSKIHDDLEEVRLTLPERPTGVDALSSPISAIYSAFSKMERSKRLVAQMEYQDKKNELLKELFRVYVDADIIALSPDEFESFIWFCNVDDGFLRTATEYELIAFFQQRYKEYIALKQ